MAMKCVGNTKPCLLHNAQEIIPYEYLGGVLTLLLGLVCFKTIQLDKVVDVDSILGYIHLQRSIQLL